MLRHSLEGGAAGVSPDTNIQSHSLPSSVTDTLEAMVGGGLDDLTLEDIDPTNANLTEEQSEVCVCVCVRILRVRARVCNNLQGSSPTPKCALWKPHVT